MMPVASITPLSSILCFVAAAFLGAVGQFLYKSGAAAANSGWFSYVLNAKLAAGVVCYIAVMALFVAAFRQGGSLLVLYPIYASTFIWAALIAWRFEGATITPLNVLGMMVLVVGMALMGWKA